MEPELQTVYWEKQIYALCGVHCLNSLLQGPFFDESKLASIAHELNAKEKQLMQAEGVTTPEFLMYMAQDSHNVAEDGNYSIQVLEQALKKVGEGLKIDSQKSNFNKSQYVNQKAFILHKNLHWFSIRKIGDTFYNFNSLYAMPEVVPDEILPIFLFNLKSQGCQIWIINGIFPPINKEMYKDLNDNQMLVSIQKINDYTEQKIIQNMLNQSQANAAGICSTNNHQNLDELILQKKISYENNHLNLALPKHKNALKPIDGYTDGYIGQIQKPNAAAKPYNSKPIQTQSLLFPSPSPSSIPSSYNLHSTNLFSNYDKFDIADPKQDIQFFQLIRNQIIQHLPSQQPTGPHIQIIIDDAKKFIRNFSPFSTIQQLYDYTFIMLTTNISIKKQKIKFYLQQWQSKQPLLDVNVPIQIISDQNCIKLKVKFI